MPVSGGTRYGTLASELLRRGFALHNLATAVNGLKLVTADGPSGCLETEGPQSRLFELAGKWPAN